MRGRAKPVAQGLHLTEPPQLAAYILLSAAVSVILV
jgi:hypothetical protein